MACPGCGTAAAAVFFHSPPVPLLANELLPTPEAARRAPRGEIALAHCPVCDLIWNTAFDPARLRYTGAYENALHFSPRFREYAEATARGLVERHGLRGRLVAEIGCGDGAFLGLLCRLGGNRGIGFDPAHDPARALPLPEGVTIHARDFDPADAALRPDLVCCRHVLEHMADPRGFLAAVRRLAGGGVVFVEVPNARHMLEQEAIWDVVYEHCLYLGAGALTGLFRGAGLAPLAVGEAYDGQFLTIEARPTGADPAHAVGPVGEDVAPEGLVELATTFARAHAEKLARWRETLRQVEREGREAVLWGAGSKGVTFLNLLGASAMPIRHVVDVNPRKQGCYVAGTGQEIVPPARLPTLRPGLVIVMNPLYRDEVQAELARLEVPAAVLVA